VSTVSCAKASAVDRMRVAFRKLLGLIDGGGKVFSAGRMR
jgi:hypothetical protein